MGEYNPHAPVILGQEWVPIRGTPYSLDIETETGHTFSIPTSSTIVSGGYYLDEVPPSSYEYMTVMMNVYRKNWEDLTGPVKKLLIPVNGGSVTLGSPTLVGGSTVADVLSAPNDGKHIFYGPSVTSAVVSVYFDVDSYTAELSGKRILDVNIIYTLSGPPPNSDNREMWLVLTPNSNTHFTIYTFTPEVFANNLNAARPLRVGLGNVNHFTGVEPDDQRRYPWRFQDLQRMQVSHPAAARLDLTWESYASTGDDDMILAYTAMEITYCEETRLAFGGWAMRQLGTWADPHPQRSMQAGQNIVQLRPSNSTAVTGTVLTPGDYTVTVNLADAGSQLHNVGTKPVTKALRELYGMPAQEGVQLVRTLTEDLTFTRTVVDVLPQLSLHTSSSCVTGVHAYGNQIGAPVYDGIDVTQDLVQRSGGAAVSFPQVRFYARRFGDTNVALSFFRTATPAQSVSISVTDFDELPEIVDGWREVNLRFDTVPTFDNTGNLSEWTWRSSGVAVNNQWQVLVTRAVSVTGTGVYNTDKATYGGPSADVFSPIVSVDDSGDAVFLFSQDPPAVTGLGVAVQTQTLETATQGCSLPAECVPTGLFYHRVTWLPTSSLGATGFGYYELQRQDDVEPEWNTILHATSVAVTGYSDYEARVGVESRYRIRVANALDFFGAWSSSVASTLTAPGVAPSAVDSSVLIFTTNHHQEGGSNLAYVEVWERAPDQDFSFPEAGRVELRELYGRDFSVAFRTAERGGERFSRTILVNNVAVPTTRIRNGFTSLRDMAWEDSPYICVRNELGDRWFTTVLVPSGSIKRNRRLYVARVDIIEVTATPHIHEISE